LNTGLTALADGTVRLSQGSTTLRKGSHELAERLASGAKLVKGLQGRDELIGEKAKVIASPVQFNTVRVNPVNTYGTGFAPYFLSLSLWVGALLLFFAIDPTEPGADLRESGFIMPILGKFTIIVFFSALQGLISSGAVHLLLHAPVVHTTQYYGFGVITAVSFACVMYVLVSGFGMAGRFISLVLLMLQLTSCGGTFPPETIPNFFQRIKPFLPMTYSVAGFKGVISGNGLSEALVPALILIGTGVLALLLTPAVVRRDVENNRLAPVAKSMAPDLKR
jgi:putative membrane protein